MRGRGTLYLRCALDRRAARLFDVQEDWMSQCAGPAHKGWLETRCVSHFHPLARDCARELARTGAAWPTATTVAAAVLCTELVSLVALPENGGSPAATSIEPLNGVVGTSRKYSSDVGLNRGSHGAYIVEVASLATKLTFEGRAHKK